MWVPRYGAWTPEKGWIIEGHGVDMDYDVESDPNAWVRGIDPQLDRGIAYLLEELKRNPPKHPTEPPPRSKSIPCSGPETERFEIATAGCPTVCQCTAAAKATMMRMISPTATQVMNCCAALVKASASSRMTKRSRPALKLPLISLVARMSRR